MRPSFTTPLAIAAVLFVLGARAGEPSASLVVTRVPGAETCIEAAPLERAVTARLHRNAFRAAPADLEIAVRLERDTNGWLATVDLQDASGAPLGRRLLDTTAEHCSALDDSLALVIALLVQTPPSPITTAPSAAEPAAPPPENTPRPGAPSPPAPAAAEHPRALSLPRDTFAPRAPWRLGASLAGVVALGPLPEAALGAELGVVAQPPRLPELRAFANVLQRRTQSVTPSAGARIALWDVGLELCGTPLRSGALSFFACGGQSVGRVTAEAYGFDVNRRNEQLSFALLGGGGLRLALGAGLAIRAGARAELLLSRGAFVYGSRDGAEKGLFRMSPLGGLFELGLEASH